jgi:outer membrane immunogenic protein
MWIKAWLIGSVLALLSAVPAISADFPRKAAAAVPYVNTFSWTGLLVGGEIGYASNDLSADLSGVLAGSASSTTGSFAAGFVIDLLYELPGTPLVVGSELSIDRVFASASASSQPSWLGKAGPLVGFTPAQQWLVYAVGGGAYQALDGNLTVANGILNIDPKGDGWFIGAGIKYAIPGVPIVIGVEYTHTDITGPSLNVQNAAFLSTGSLIDQVMFGVQAKF